MSNSFALIVILNSIKYTEFCLNQSIVSYASILFESKRKFGYFQWNKKMMMHELLEYLKKQKN